MISKAYHCTLVFLILSDFGASRRINKAKGLTTSKSTTTSFESSSTSFQKTTDAVTTFTTSDENECPYDFLSHLIPCSVQIKLAASAMHLQHLGFYQGIFGTFEEKKDPCTSPCPESTSTSSPCTTTTTTKHPTTTPKIETTNTEPPPTTTTIKSTTITEEHPTSSTTRSTTTTEEHTTLSTTKRATTTEEHPTTPKIESTTSGTSNILNNKKYYYN